MKILWIGAGMGPKLMQQVLAHGGKIMSSFVSQTNIVEGLDSLNVNMDTLNVPKIDEDVLSVIPDETWQRKEGSWDRSAGYRNIVYVNRLLEQSALVREAKQWSDRQSPAEAVCILVYGMHTPFLAAACAVKRRLKDAKICLIVPDLPQYMDLHMSNLKKVLKKLDWMRIEQYRKQVDQYILYASPMAEFLNITDCPWTVVEGSYNSNMFGVPQRDQTGKISVMYSGVLDLRYGIPELLDAMKLLDEHYELWLTGDGNATDLIRERQKEDPRIKFFGFLPSKQDLLDKQATASMLISPRKDSETASKYCFPSKLFEYMASGKPVLSCFLEGIPEEYHPYLMELKEVTPEEIARVIRRTAELPEADRSLLGQRAKQFVLEEKNKVAQAKRILSFIGGI